MTKDETAHGAGEKWPAVVPLDSCASVFNELAVFHAGGAGSFASAAVEAFVHVLDEGIGNGLVVQFDVNHLANSAARRIRFEVPETVGGTGVEAESAVSAAGEIFVDGVEAGDGVSWHAQIYDRGRIAGTQLHVVRD